MEKLEYRGGLQPDRWRLHPEDFAVRIEWEGERQRILDLQAASIEKGLAYPKEKIPPIPVLKHPGYHLHLRTVTESVTEPRTVTETVTAGEAIVTRICPECHEPVEGRGVYCGQACKQAAWRKRAEKEAKDREAMK